MNIKEYEQLIEEFTEKRKGVSDSKRKDYTQGKSDVLANFKQVAEYTGLEPLQVWMVYASKHWDSICSYVKNGTESEPIESRFGDLAVYLELGWALIKEKEMSYVEPIKENGIDFAYDGPKEEKKGFLADYGEYL